MSRKLLISILSGLIILLIGVGSYLFLTGQNYQKIASKSLIGGDFEMLDHNGKTVTQDDYKGYKKLIFFGFTNCPAVCPTELNNIALALDELSLMQQKNIKVLFVSIDPDYDTPAIMKDYVRAFSDDFIGLTGSNEQVAKIAQTYKIYYAKIPEENSEIGYTMNHTAYTYLMDKNNQYLTHLRPQAEIEDMVKTLRDYM